MLAAWQMFFGIAPLLVLGLAVDGNPARFHWTAMALFCLLYLAVIGSALTFLLLYWLLPRLTVAQLQSISLITPTRCRHARVGVRRRKLSYLFLVRCRARSCQSLDDFSKSKRAGASDSRGLIAWVAIWGAGAGSTHAGGTLV